MTVPADTDRHLGYQGGGFFVFFSVSVNGAVQFPVAGIRINCGIQLFCNCAVF